MRPYQSWPKQLQQFHFGNDFGLAIFVQIGKPNVKFISSRHIPHETIIARRLCSVNSFKAMPCFPDDNESQSEALKYLGQFPSSNSFMTIHAQYHPFRFRTKRLDDDQCASDAIQKIVRRLHKFKGRALNRSESGARLKYASMNEEQGDTARDTLVGADCPS